MPTIKATPTMRNRVLKVLSDPPDVAVPPQLIATGIGYSLRAVKDALRMLKTEGIAESIPTFNDRGQQRTAWRLTAAYRVYLTAQKALPDVNANPALTALLQEKCRVSEVLNTGETIHSTLPTPDGSTDPLSAWTFLGIPLFDVVFGPTGTVFTAEVAGRSNQPAIATAHIQWGPAQVEWAAGLYLITPRPSSSAWARSAGAAPDLAGAVALAWNWENSAS